MIEMKYNVKINKNAQSNRSHRKKKEGDRIIECQAGELIQNQLLKTSMEGWKFDNIISMDLQMGIEAL